jgi:heme/copper-type cytochrome/quinol oxidase subunit 2
MAGNEFAETVLGDNTYSVEDTSFDSYMIADDELDSKKFHHIRLLAVDNYVTLPTQQNIRVLVTAADVIHS